MFLRTAILVAASSLAFTNPTLAQESGMQMPMGDMHMTMHEAPLGIDHVRDGPGTSWLPEASPMDGLMRDHGAWTLMLHGNAFLQDIDAGSDRGDDQFGSINWLMGMARRPWAGGEIRFSTMLSLEPLTVGKCGYPLLLQSGEVCDGAALHDRQHPHDLFMEVSADYRRALGNSLAIELYGGPAGEAALGPTGFAHRFSALPNPVAPISHHWLDSSHISFGVITAGLYGKKWKAEGSVFNGREPDDARYDFDLAALDSYSGRLWFLPNAAWSIQVSAGHLTEAEHHAEASEDADRVTASATYHRLVNDRLWATTFAWGQNREGGQTSAAFLGETAVDVSRRDTIFARAEVVGKTALDLALSVPGDQIFTVSKFQAGYTRWLARAGGVKAGLGASAGIAVLPENLRPYYGSRSAGEFAVFLTVRPK